ncbi:MAG TPA: HAD family phosphatase [Leptolyngbyaceae cyanobacterium M65_K2018_010]|nr:HAD family phosphatase [Leptolyngbyaceae cyanobacterium M65_K2018_010]
MITHIVSDMGGVLVELQWQDRVEKLLNRPLPMEDLHRLWVSAPSTVDFESGRTDFDQFAAAFIQEFDLAISPATLQQEFLEIVQAPLPRCDQLLRALKPRYHLSLLSNTNPAHYQKLRDRYTFFDHFDQLFLSYQLGVMKPSPTIFEFVLDQLGTAPEQVAFFDDGAGNVEAARRLGIQAFRVDSPDQIWAVVEKLSLDGTP